MNNDEIQHSVNEIAKFLAVRDIDKYIFNLYTTYVFKLRKVKLAIKNTYSIRCMQFMLR
jgi:hypothetical protein